MGKRAPAAAPTELTLVRGDRKSRVNTCEPKSTVAPCRAAEATLNLVTQHRDELQFQVDRQNIRLAGQSTEMEGRPRCTPLGRRCSSPDCCRSSHR